MDRQDGRLIDTSPSALANLGAPRRYLPKVFQETSPAEMGPRPYHRACQWRDALGEQPTAALSGTVPFDENKAGRGGEVIELSAEIAKRGRQAARADNSRKAL